jgi:hypothetical protein
MASLSASCKCAHTSTHTHTHTFLLMCLPIKRTYSDIITEGLDTDLVSSTQNNRFQKLSVDNVATGIALLMFAKGGEDRTVLDLPARLALHVPQKINATCKRIVIAIEKWPTIDKSMEYVEFAAMFGLSEVQAYEAELAAASVRIQALARKKQANAVTVERRLKAMEKQEVAAVYTKAL